MTDEELIEDIKKAVNKSMTRFKENIVIAEGKMGDDKTFALLMLQLSVAEFMTGAQQIAYALAEREGELTPQQMLRCIQIVGNNFGMKLEMSKE